MPYHTPNASARKNAAVAALFKGTPDDTDIGGGNGPTGEIRFANGIPPGNGGGSCAGSGGGLSDRDGAFGSNIFP
jgi:hypothetical protein